ncbi:MAG: recombination regulator RecX [Ignavibacteriaceae bacterium]|jgi:regulatory protein|nr:recombination regulator RecX [Ignavibacteriaceae bacterium]
MRILRVVKKGKSDVILYFDNDSLLFLAVEVFLKSGLKKSDDISEDRFSLLIEQNKIFHIKQKAFRLLGRRQHSSSELRRKLWNKDYEQKLIDEVIDDLQKKGYLDDKEFIRAFVAEKSKSRNWSSKKIKGELFKRGVASKLIDETLNHHSVDSDNESAMKLAKKKYEVLLKRNLEPKELQNKLSTYLFSKGFDYELIREVICKLIKAKDDEF